VIPDTVKNETSLPQGASPPKIAFSVQDAGGNLLVGSGRVAIRVRIVPRLNATLGRSAASVSMSSSGRGRRLLQSSNSSGSTCDQDTPLEFVFVQNSSNPDITAGPEFLCRAGVNDMFFDVGTYSVDSFSPTSSNAFKMSVTVIPGVFKSFVIVDVSGTLAARSYELIHSLEIMFLDAGLNEVSGSATMALVSVNASAFVYPAQSFTISANETFKAYAPSFFMYATDWAPMVAPIFIRIAATNSSVPQYGSKDTAVHLNWTCAPGHRLVTSSVADFFSLLKVVNQNLTDAASGAFSKCVSCAQGTVSSIFDAQTCRFVFLFFFVSNAT
jgi:hypothetical protein